MGNVELFESGTTDATVHCQACYKHVLEGIIFCLCWCCLRPDEDILDNVKERFKTLIASYYVPRMRISRGKKHGEQPWHAHHWKAKDAYKEVRKHKYSSMRTDGVMTRCTGTRNTRQVGMRPAAGTWTTSTRSTFPATRRRTSELDMRTRLFQKAVTRTFKRVPSRDVRVRVHGDDFTVAGNDSELKYVAEVFQNKYKTKARRILGSDIHDMKAMTILNRIVEWTDAGIQYEADPRHVDLIIEELGLENANGSDVTGSKVDINETETELDHEDAYRFKSIAAKLNFLAADTVDIQFASKEICRRMSSACLSDWAKVRKLGRFLRKHLRQVLWFAWQDVQSNLQVQVDTDNAGCPRTRGPPTEAWSCTGATC